MPIKIIVWFTFLLVVTSCCRQMRVQTGASETVRENDVCLSAEVSPRIIQIEAGMKASCVLYDDGSIVCWGRWSKQKRDVYQTPTLLEKIPRARIIAMGIEGDVWEESACLVAEDGRIICGWLGDRPIEITGVSDPIGIATQRNRGCAIASDKTLFCWKLPNPFRAKAWDKIPAERMEGIDALSSVSLAVSAFRALNWGCGLSAQDGRVVCFGTRATRDEFDFSSNSGIFDVGGKLCAFKKGEILCNGSRVVSLPHHVDLAQMSVGTDGGCGVDHDGAAYCWGTKMHGLLGCNKRFAYSKRAVRIALPPTLSVSRGEKHACALTKGGEVYCWGSNEHGQLGTTASGILKPVPSALGPAEDIALRFDRTCAIGNGAVWCTGGQEVCPTSTFEEVVLAESHGNFYEEWQYSHLTAGGYGTCVFAKDSAVRAVMPDESPQDDKGTAKESVEGVKLLVVDNEQVEEYPFVRESNYYLQCFAARKETHRYTSLMSKESKRSIADNTTRVE